MTTKLLFVQVLLCAERQVYQLVELAEFLSVIPIFSTIIDGASTAQPLSMWADNDH